MKYNGKYCIASRDLGMFISYYGKNYFLKRLQLASKVVKSNYFLKSGL